MRGDSSSPVWATFLGCVPARPFDEVGHIADVVPHVVSGFDPARGSAPSSTMHGA